MASPQEAKDLNWQYGPTSEKPKTQVATNWTKVLQTKVVRLDEDFIKWMGKKLNITWINIPILKKLWNSNDPRSNRFKYRNNKLSIFPHIHNLIIRNMDSDNDINLNVSFKEVSLFNIKQVYTQDEYYIFEDTNWNFFYVNILDFDTNWVTSESLSVWKPPIDTISNQVSWLTINNTITSIDLIKNGKTITWLVWDHIVVVDKDKWDVIIVNQNLIEYMNIDWNGAQTQIWHSISHKYWTIEKIRIDNHKNFLLIISKYEDWRHRFHIVNRKTLEEIESHDDIVDIINIDNKNDLTCLDKNGKLVSINGNLDQFPVGFVDNWTIWKKQVVEVVDIAQSQLEALLSNGWIKIDASDLSNPKKINWNWKDKNQELISKIWETKIWEKTLKELFEEANNEEEIDTVYKILLQIKSNPLVISVSGITDNIEKDINNKKYKLKLQDIKDKLNLLNNMFEQTIEEMNKWDFANFPTLLVLQTNAQELRQSRSQLPIIDNELDKSIKKLSDEIDWKILEFRLKK